MERRRFLIVKRRVKGGIVPLRWWSAVGLAPSRASGTETKWLVRRSLGEGGRCRYMPAGLPRRSVAEMGATRPRRDQVHSKYLLYRKISHCLPSAQFPYGLGEAGERTAEVMSGTAWRQDSCRLFAFPGPGARVRGRGGETGDGEPGRGGRGMSGDFGRRLDIISSHLFSNCENIIIPLKGMNGQELSARSFGLEAGPDDHSRS